MKLSSFLVPFLALAAVPLMGCSSSDGSGDDNTIPSEERAPIGKEDSLAGKCNLNGVSYCGGKSKKKCWCDSECSTYGDCCADYEASCGGGEEGCKTSADCPSGQFCSAPEGCNTLGTCKPKPTGQVCTAVMTPYCTCEGETKVATSGCINDRYAHKGACETSTFCGGIAGIPCPEGQKCVDNPNDGCDPNNGGADCGGICKPITCLPVMCTLFCENGFETDEFGCNVCSCKRVPATGACIKNSNEACSSDADCVSGGCGGELCYNKNNGGGISTCECTAPTNVGGCGCVAGKCSWYK